MPGTSHVGVKPVRLVFGVLHISLKRSSSILALSCSSGWAHESAELTCDECYGQRGIVRQIPRQAAALRQSPSKSVKVRQISVKSVKSVKFRTPPGPSVKFRTPLGPPV